MEKHPLETSSGLLPPSHADPLDTRYEVEPEYPDWLSIAEKVDTGNVPAGRAALVQKVPGGWVVMGPRGEHRSVVKSFGAVVRLLTMYFGLPVK